jgi:integrase
MPKQTITTEAIRGWKQRPPATETDVYDTKQPGLVLRLRSNGKHAYRVLLGRGKWFTLGTPDTLTPLQARTEARKRLGQVATGGDPQAEKRKARQRTLGEYLAQVYTPWLLEHRKAGARIGAEIAAAFAPLLSHKLDAVTGWQVETWRRHRLATGTVKPATTNRNLTYLRAMLSRAVEWGHLDAHPLGKVKPLPEDKIGRLRFLSPDEETRLRAALSARDTTRRAERDSANAWRLARRYPPWPTFGAYTDHLTPIVLLALNSGLRFGELTGLRWRDVALDHAILTVVTEHSKSGRARHVPLNSEAVTVLRAWRPATVDDGAYVFPGPDGARLIDIKRAWMPLLTRAQITGFRFHDVRHSFASKLVQRGVDLNTVRELLGHTDIKMTLRYAHLAPAHTAAAVATLVAR